MKRSRQPSLHAWRVIFRPNRVDHRNKKGPRSRSWRARLVELPNPLRSPQDSSLFVDFLLLCANIETRLSQDFLADSQRFYLKRKVQAGDCAFNCNETDAGLFDFVNRI